MGTATRERQVSGPNAHKTAGGVGAWKPSYLQAQPGSTCRREEHVENRSATSGCLAAATRPYTYFRERTTEADAAAVLVDLLWSWAPLRSGLGHMYQRS